MEHLWFPRKSTILGLVIRDIEVQLDNWKNSTDRKPLLVQGARQVGKTYTLKKFGETRYEETAYFNFEEDPALGEVFEGRQAPERILQLLSAYIGRLIRPGSTLLIFDEIQESNRALNSLKYFCEEAPDFHLVAAGSLLGVQLSRPGSFPVGKVKFLSLAPMSLMEFFRACGEGQIRQLIETWQQLEPVPSALHDRLVELLKYYYLTGGMPEVVAKFVDQRDLKACRELQKEILLAYELDFAKHAPNSDMPKILDIWKSLPGQLARENKKFVYSSVRPSARAREYGDALNWLEGAGLIIRCRHVSAPRLPLSSYRSEEAFKVYLLDVGLLAALSDLEPGVVVKGSELFTEFRGALAENYVAQQLVSRGIQPSYWTSTGNAEVDFICQSSGKVVPLEVKAGINPRSKSLRVYQEKYSPPVLARTTLLNFRKDGGICNFPLYAISRFPELALEQAASMV